MVNLFNRACMLGRILICIVSTLFMLSCKENGLKPISVSRHVDTITVSVSQDPYMDIHKKLTLSKLVRLDREPLVATVKDISVLDNRILLVDETNRLFCYDMEGKLVYKIDAQGNGPGEYNMISFCSVDMQRNNLWIYDAMTANLIRYDWNLGKFLDSKRIQGRLSDMAYIEGVRYYDNRSHRATESDETLFYSLLVSDEESRIRNAYFLHDDSENMYEFSPSRKCFYHSGMYSLLYCKNFDDRVYSLSSDSVSLLYQFIIPDWLEDEYIERRMDIRELLKSDISYGLCDIFECNGVVSFRFFKKGLVYSGLYDLRQGKQICCVPAILGNPESGVPLISAIVGAYKSQFISVLSPIYLDYQKNKYPQLIDELLPGYDAHEDNPVIAFYSVNE